MYIIDVMKKNIKKIFSKTWTTNKTKDLGGYKNEHIHQILSTALKKYKNHQNRQKFAKEYILKNISFLKKNNIDSADRLTEFVRQTFHVNRIEANRMIANHTTWFLLAFILEFK